MRQLLVAVSLVSIASSQSTWWQPPVATAPPYHYGHALTTEPVTGKVVMFGGMGPGAVGDTWEWNGDTWTQTGLVNPPSPRETHAMAPDGQGGIVLFGGSTGSDETWRYYQGQWTQLGPATTPPPRRSHQMAFTGQSILMFGGFWYDQSGPVCLADTWEWIGGNWVQRFPTNAPSARATMGMAHDPIRARTVLYGGSGVGISPIQETWEWDGSNWLQASPQHSPAALMGVPLTFFPETGRIVAYGGFVPDGTGTNITTIGGCYAWDGSDWSPVTLSSPNPGARASQVAWSPISNSLVLFGGHGAPTNDTWLTGPWTGSYESFGQACVGPTGTAPDLAALLGQKPRRGTTSLVRLSNLPLALTIPIFIVGFSDSWDPGGYALPVDLSVLGWTGCSQLASLDITYLAITATGSADQSLFIPSSTPLALSFYVQALVLYLPDGVALSNGVHGIVGY